MMNEMIIRTVGYALPTALHTQILDVAPTTYFVSARVMQQTPHRRSFGPEQAVSGKLVTARAGPNIRPFLNGAIPSDLRWLYRTDAYAAAAPNQNKLGVVGVGHDYASHQDLTRFTTTIDAYAAGAAFTVVQVSLSGGGYDPNNPSPVSNLQVQYAAAMGYPTPLIFYSVGGFGDPFLKFLGYMVGQPDSTITQTIGISYAHFEEISSPGYARALCNLFLQLGGRGVSVLVGSGIFGVGAGNCVEFVPEFPSTCTCGVLSPLDNNKYKSLTRLRFHRSLGH
jgi:tripeptidyl-peptidase-1